MLIARAADGGMRDALSLLDMCLGYSEQVDEKLVRSILGTSDSAFLFEFSEAMVEHDAGKVFLLIDRLMREGKDPAVFAKDVCRHIRSLLIAKTSPDELAKVMDITNEEAAEYIRQSKDITLSRLMKILDLFMSLEAEMRYSSTPRMALENVSIKCCLKIDEADGQALNDRIAELEKKLDELTAKITNGEITLSTDNKGKPRHERESGTATKEKGTAGASVPKKNVKQEDAEIWKEFMTRIQKLDITANFL